MSQQTCAHNGCTCKVDPATAIQANGKSYCSQNCAEGKPCGHSECSGCG